MWCCAPGSCRGQAATSTAALRALHLTHTVRRRGGPRTASSIRRSRHRECRRPVELAVDQKPHGHRRGVPAARRQSGKGRLLRGGLIEMERLRIVFLCKDEDLVFVDPLAAGLEYLSDGEIF